MNQRILVGTCVAALLFLSGCGPKVMIPPRIDLTRYDGVGVVGFGCNAEGNMDEFLTRRLLITLSSYQKEARIVDLGREEELIQLVQADRLNPEVVQATGQKFNLGAIVTGNLEITEVKPLVKLYRRGERPISGQTQIAGKRASAEIKVWISARLWETTTGATVWRVSERGEEMVDQVSFPSEQKAIFDARDQEKAFGNLINPLVKKVCDDFKIKYRRIKQDSR